MKRILTVLSVLLISGFVPFNVYAIDYIFTTIDYPGAYYGTAPNGIDGNNIVGTYMDIDVKNHGFLYNGSTYTPINVPGALQTYAYGIDGKNIVGYYADASYKVHGFLYNGSTYTTLDVPGALETAACGIDGKNIVGWYHLPQYPGVFRHGFLYDGSTYTTFDVPGAINTWAYSISGNNIVGTYEDTKNKIQGFLYDGSTYTTLNYPGASLTYAYGIDGNNIVGGYWNANQYTNGFLYNGSTYIPINVPGASFGTVAYGIDGNNIVGSYSDGYKTHGFLATPVGPQPSPDIKANNSDGPISIKSSDLLSVTAQLNAMGYTVNADWWMVANTPMGWYHYDVRKHSWQSGLVVTHQGPLFDLSTYEVLNMSGLPTGSYTFYFGVDMNMNGSLNMDQAYYDSVVVNIIQ